MADVPHDFIRRRVQNPVQGNGEFDNPKRTGKVPAGLGYRIDDFFPNFPSQNLKLFHGKTL
jgi:hypothetical protein